METIEISCFKKFRAIFGLVAVISVLILLLMMISINYNNFLLLNLCLIFLGLQFLIFYRIRNKRLYYYTRFGDLVPFFNESAIRITDEYITLKIRENPSFFIFWTQFEIIKISKKIIKLFGLFTIKRYKIQFYTYYPNYAKGMKYISSFMLKSRHFSSQQCEEIVSSLEKFSFSLNKKIIEELT